MLNFSKIILLLLCSIVVSGCATNSINRDAVVQLYEDGAFEKDKHAIVVFDVKENGSSVKSFSLKSSRINYVEYEPRFKGFLKGWQRDYSSAILILKPGIYLIEYITLEDSGGLRRWLPGPAMTPEGIIAYGAFKVEAGEVLALGSLGINNNKFTHLKEFDLIKDNLKAADQFELLKDIKPGQLFTRGSLLMKNKSGQLSLVHAHVVDSYRKSLLNQVKDNISKDMNK